MAGDPIFGDAKPGLLARFLRLISQRSTPAAIRSVKRREQLDVLVPTGKAEAVRAAVERWLVENGVTANVTVEDAGNERSRVRAKLSETESAKIDLSAEAVQAALENLLADAMS
jgi:hypothetical protein